MSFLAPFAGLLAGALGVAALVALQALKLRRRPVRISSTLLWRNAVRDLEVNIPFRAPRITVLFLLQLLAILLLAAAIARPVTGSADRIPGRLIVVIDASASMNAADADASGTTRIDHAKAAAESRLRDLRRGAGTPEIAVVRAALEPRMAVAPTRSLDAALAGVRAIEPSDQPLDPDALRAMLNALLDRSAQEEEGGTESTEPTLWIFTDAGTLAPRDFPGWSGEIIATHQPPTPPTPPQDTEPGSAPPLPVPGVNTGIADLIATRDPADPTTARVFLRVVSNADRPTGVVVRLSTGERTVSVAMEIPAATDEAPGSATRAVTLPAPGAARIEAALDRGGVLASDDTAWTDLPDARPPRTVVFAPEGRADPFLLDVLGVLAPGGVSAHTPNELDALTGAELVIYDRVTPARLPPVPSIGFGSAWPGDDEALDEGRQRIVAWDRAHPVLRDLSLATVVFDRAVRLPDETAPGVTVLAEARSGPVVIEAVGGGVRHLRVAFPLTRSNWSVDVGMPIFVAAAIERLTPGVRGEGVTRTTTRPIELRSSADRVTAAGPAEAAAPTADGVAVLGPLPRVGVYTLAGAAEPTVAVSLLDASESAIPLGLPARFGRDAAANASDAVQGRRERWPELLLAAFVVMTVEWLLHARRARV